MPQRAQDALAVAGHELSALADNLPNPAWIAYPDGAIFWYNRAWYDYTGRSPDEMLGWGWASVHHPDELERVTAEWIETLASGSTFEMTFPLRRHDGVYRLFLTRVVPITETSGQIVRWFGTNVDITAQVAAEERLRRAEADWRGLFDEMQEGFIIGELVFDKQGVAIDGIIVRANARMEALTGIPHGEAVGRSARDVAGRDAYFFTEILTRVVATGVPATFELQAEQLQRSFEVRAYRHSQTQFAMLFLDVTARKLAEQEARRAQGNLLRVSRLSAMGAMASTLSHELNQPIGAASNFIAAANEHVKRAEDIDPALLRRLFESAIGSCQRAGQIIRSMRDFTASGTVAKKPEHLRELINASIEEFRGLASNAPIAFKIDCPATMPLVPCDRIQIVQVLLNLYGNGARAMADLPNKRIKLAARADDSRVTLSVADNGHGLKDRTPELLFEPFWSTTDVGLGLGLPLCRTIVEAHAGTIRAEPGPGGGAVFVIQLPLLDG